MESIFISYRREDSEGQAGRLYDDLAARFGDDRVFMDVAGIGVGSDFRKVIEERVARCAVLLVVIGKRWLDARDAAGQRRLDNPADFVRLETASALKREHITVVPVLIGGAAMPEARDLPPDLQALAFRNAAPLSHTRWQSDLDVLSAELHRLLNAGVETTLPPPPTSRRAQRSRHGERRVPWTALALLALAALVAVPAGFFLYAKYEVMVAEDALRIARARAEATAAEADAAERLRRQQLAAAEEKEQAARQAEEAASAARAESAAAAARQDEDAARVAKAAEQEAQRKAEETAEAARREAAAAEQAREESERKAEQDRLARLELERAAKQASVAGERTFGGGSKAAAAAAPAARSPEELIKAQPPAAGLAGGTPVKWQLSANCGGRVDAAGTVAFVLQPSGEGVLVGASFNLSGGGYAVSGSAQQRFDRAQPSYRIATTASWKGAREFSTQQEFEVFAQDGVRFARAEQRSLRTVCP